MFSRCRFSIPRTTWGYVAILAVIILGAVMREINLLIILAGLMGGPLLMSWQLIRLTLRNVSVTRKTPHGVFPGQTFVVEFSVCNRRKRLDSWALVIEDSLRNVLEGKAPEPKTARCLIPYVAAGGTAHASYRAQLSERGRYRFGPLRLSTKVPVGLLKGRVLVKEMSDVLVYPRLGRLKAAWSDLVKYDQVGQQSWRRRQGSVEGDFYGLRDWRPGDSRRWIHWRSSAKRQELVVRQFEQHRSQDLVVLLDLFQPASSSRASDDTAPGVSALRDTALRDTALRDTAFRDTAFRDTALDDTALDDTALDDTARLVEKAICFVATVVSDHCRRGGGRLTLGVAGRQPCLLRGTASSALLNDALEMLAEATATPQDEFPALLPDVLARTSAGDRLMVVTTRPTDLADAQRFPARHDDMSNRATLSRSLCLDVSRPEFDDLFDDLFDANPSSAPVSTGTTATPGTLARREVS